MKHIKKYSDFDKVNEELLGGVLNFLKGMWKKAISEIEKIGNDVNSIKEYVVNNTLNPKDDTSPLNKIIKDFSILKTANDQACMDLIVNLLDPATGALGKQGIGLLFNDKSLQGDKLKVKRVSIEYIVSESRNKTISDIKYQTDATKRNVKLTDKTYLPDLKKILLNAKQDESKKKVDTLNWVNSIIDKLKNNVKSLREDDIKEALNKNGVKSEGDYKIGDLVQYKMNGYNDTLKSEDQKDKIGEKKITKIDGDMITFLDKDGKEFNKDRKDIIGKASIDDGSNDSAKEAAVELGKIKNDKEKMSKVSNFAKFLNDPKNANKLPEIEKIIGK